MTQNQISIHVKSVIKPEAEAAETIEFHTTGTYQQKNEKTYLTYHEEHEMGKVKTVVKLSETEIFVMRSGAIQMKQRFLSGETTETHYQMPFGTLQLEVHTHEIELDLEKGLLHISYDMLTGENQKHLHTLSISYKEDLRS
ncbi:DUF1934 domain-containing protein [Bacillus sp. NPDC077027]|uniref:DUF1934 domain-containing protein n=1 Tax=Bacillus sp. NPDC077027 TaxID=3390548 RepID=UPI003D01B105